MTAVTLIVVNFNTGALARACVERAAADPCSPCGFRLQAEVIDVMGHTEAV